MPESLFLRKRLWHRCFPVNFAKFLRTLSLQNTSGRLLHFYIIIYKRKKKGSIRISAYFSLFSLSSRKQRKRLFFLKKKFFWKYCILKTSCESFLMKFLEVNNFLRNYLQMQPPDMFCIKRYSKNFASFTGKHLCWNVLWSLQ